MKIQRIVLQIILLAMLFSVTVLADSQGVTAKIAVTSFTEGKAGAPAVRIVPENENQPMPDKDSLVPENGSGEFLIRYEVPGDYHYRIFQEPSKDTALSCDESVYLVTVRIINSGKDSLESEVWAEEQKAHIKAAVSFENRQKPVESSDPVILGITAQSFFKLWIYVLPMFSGLLFLTAVIRRRRSGDPEETKEGRKGS